MNDIDVKNIPQTELTLRVLAFNKGRLGKCRKRVASTSTKNVAKTLEISTSAKIMLLWLQCGGSPSHAAAATFSLNLIKHMNY